MKFLVVMIQVLEKRRKVSKFYPRNMKSANFTSNFIETFRVIPKDFFLSLEINSYQVLQHFSPHLADDPRVNNLSQILNCQSR